MVRKLPILLALAACGRADVDGDFSAARDCAATCAGSADDGEALRAPGVVRAGARDVLVLLPPGGLAWDDVRTIAIHLEGFGLRPEYAVDPKVVDLAAYSDIIVAHSSWELVTLDATDGERLAEAVAGGTDLLWIGLGVDPELERTFGVEVAGAQAAGPAGIQEISWRLPDRDIADAPVFESEYLTQLVPAGAEVYATFEPAGQPAMTVHRPDPAAGRAVLIPFGLPHYWGEDRSPDAWARAELLHDGIDLMLAQGNVLIEPMPHARNGAFLLRVEDISPGGSVYSQNFDDWIDRFLALGNDLDRLGVSPNLSVVPRYVDPFNGESNGWTTPDPNRERLLAALRYRLARGDTLIAHGWTHQYGQRETDYTGLDWEFSDDSSGEWVFLPYPQQKERVGRSMDELEQTFGTAPAVWETPHLEGNADTYLAAAEVGFRYVNEEDGHLFPNRWGEFGVIGDQGLNVPHTASFVPMEDPGDYVDLCTTWTMPRLTRIGAPFFLFYHGFTDEQAEAVRQLASCAARCDVWTPSVVELARWWEARDEARIEVEAEDGLLRAVTEQVPDGLTLDVRLPDGTLPTSVTVDGAEAEHTVVQRRGIAHVRVVLPGGDRRVTEVGYQP